MSLLQTIQKNRVFKYLASVRTAVPLMLVLLITCAAGTIIESRYESKIATIMVYRSWWFELLLLFLWVNIFCATLSRAPFKNHHIGFIITHIGLLTLLIGAVMTSEVGVDGELRIEQGRSENKVFVAKMVLQTRDSKGALEREISIPRSLSPLSMSELSSINKQLGSNLLIEHYAPFVSIQSGLQADPSHSGPPAVRFRLKSQFFDVTESLHLTNRPELQMGPATLRIVASSALTKLAASTQSSPPPPARRKAPAQGKNSNLTFKDAKTGSTLGEVSLLILKKGPQKVGIFEISLVHQFEDAVVAGGKLAEQGTPGKNPALELSIQHQGQKTREIVFAKFPGFSLHPGGAFGLKVEWDFVAGSGGTEASGSSHEIPMHSQESTPTIGMPAGNLVEFSPGPLAADGKTPTVHLRLAKAGQTVLEMNAQSGETVQTPWMGMQLTIEEWLQSASSGEAAENVQPIALQERAGVPPSALRIRSLMAPESAPIWLVEGSSRNLIQDGHTLEIYYGPQPVELPFSIHLEKFSKVDYPGTETAMSYESEVRVNELGSPIRIAMNEPLKRDGFTLYQSSYSLEPGQPPVSIFSVNRDPGRPIKYAGSLTLVVGIAVFTIMRSRWYLTRNKVRAPSEMKGSKAV